MDGVDFYLYQGGNVNDLTVTNVVVEEGIEKIDFCTFAFCYALVHVSIPDSVTYIGRSAFSQCYNLTTIAIPDGVKTIENGTFKYCRSLESIRLPDSIISIGPDAFSHCESLRTIAIPNGVEEIGARAFEKSGIQEFVLPNGIKVIPEQAFFDCPSLQTMELPSSVKEIVAGAFRSCYNLENFVRPNGLPKLTKLNLDAYRFGVHGLHLITQLIVNSPNLEDLSLKNVGIKRTAESGNRGLHNNDIPVLLDLVSLCPSLRILNVSYNFFTQRVFETLASQHVPGHLRRLKIFPRQADWRNSRVETHDLMRVLEANPKLGLWTRQFWHDSEDQKVRHHLEMNKYGCRGFAIPDALWPLLIERLAALEREREEDLPRNPCVSRNEIETGAPNILYPLLRRHSELFLRPMPHAHRKRKRDPMSKLGEHRSKDASSPRA